MSFLTSVYIYGVSHAVFFGLCSSVILMLVGLDRSASLSIKQITTAHFPGHHLEAAAAPPRVDSDDGNDEG